MAKDTTRHIEIRVQGQTFLAEVLEARNSDVSDAANAHEHRYGVAPRSALSRNHRRRRAVDRADPGREVRAAVAARPSGPQEAHDHPASRHNQRVLRLLFRIEPAASGSAGPTGAWTTLSPACLRRAHPVAAGDGNGTDGWRGPASGLARSFRSVGPYAYRPRCRHLA